MNRSLDAETVTPNIPRIMAATTFGTMTTVAAKIAALVCYAPNAKGVSVQDNPESDIVVGTLNSKLIMQEEDPSTYLFLHITTRGGRAGWIKRTDVRWIPCLIVGPDRVVPSDRRCALHRSNTILAVIWSLLRLYFSMESVGLSQVCGIQLLHLLRINPLLLRSGR